MEYVLGSIAIFMYSHLIGRAACSIEKLKFENIIFQCYQSLNCHSAGGCSNQNRLLNFDILMLLGDNYLQNSQRTTANPLAIKYHLRF